MPTRDEKESFLKKCINSIINQVFNDFEYLIIINPEDRNFEYINQLSVTNNQIKLLINNIKPSVSTSRNIGIKNSKSKYIALVDSDDYYHPERFSKQLNYLEQNSSISVIGSNILLVDEKNNIIGKRIYPQNPDEIKKQFLYKMPVANPSIVVRRDDINEVGLFDDNFNKAEDFELWLRFLAKNKKMYNIQENLVYYRTTEDANKKRGHRHYKNYYIALKRHSKFIWPFGIRLISLLMFFIIQLIPNRYLSILLNTKIVNKIKSIKTDISKTNVIK